jgi:hypothetical protein
MAFVVVLLMGSVFNCLMDRDKPCHARVRCHVAITGFKTPRCACCVTPRPRHRPPDARCANEPWPRSPDAALCSIVSYTNLSSELTPQEVCADDDLPYPRTFVRHL